jgi:hypothetical protein
MGRLTLCALLFSVWAHHALAESIKIVKATYGIINDPPRTCNAMPVVSKLCNGLKTCSVLVAPDLCSGDPASGAKKELLVRYRCGVKKSGSDRKFDDQTAELSCDSGPIQ